MQNQIHWIEEHIVHAGKLAMALFGNVSPSIKQNESYVTQADLEVQSYLVDAIRSSCPDDGIIAEEDEVSIQPAQGERTWIIDPIDGTSSFVRGFPTWGIAVGIVEGDTPVGGFFYMPTTGDFFKTSKQGEVIKNDEVIRPRALPNQQKESVLLVDSKFHRMFEVDPDYRGKIRSLGSASAHASYVATGSADAVLFPDLPVWDLAMGIALLSNAGASILYYDGSPVSLRELVEHGRANQPLLCGQPQMIEHVQTYCRLKR